MANEFIITPKGEKSITISVRIEKWIQDEFDKLSTISGRSRNELLNMALKFALENVHFTEAEA